MFLFDVDDTLLDFTNPALSALRDAGYRVLNAADYDLSKCVFPDSAQPHAKVLLKKLITNPQFMSSLNPRENAADVLTWLHRRTLVKGYVTARPEAQRQITTTWLRENGFPSVPVYMATAGVARAELMRQLGAKVLADDNIENLQAACNAGLIVIAVHQPHNASFAHPNALRLYEWSGFQNLFSAIPTVDGRQKTRRF